jgi:hypothetical protein
MGHCTITVHLSGSYHTKDNPKDANRMTAKFVDELKAAGHSVQRASFTSGGREDLLDPHTLTRTMDNSGTVVF